MIPAKVMICFRRREPRAASLGRTAVRAPAAAAAAAEPHPRAAAVRGAARLGGCRGLALPVAGQLAAAARAGPGPRARPPLDRPGLGILPGVRDLGLALHPRGQGRQGPAQHLQARVLLQRGVQHHR